MTRIIVLFLLLVCIILPAKADESKNFDAWLKEFYSYALQQGIREATLKKALDGLAFNERVLELDRQQPEKMLSFDQYIKNVLTPDKIKQGKKKLKLHWSDLTRTADLYGVDPAYIVALWGIESNFGQNIGNFYIIPALATLAYEGRRRTFFQRELINALKIVDEGHIPLSQFKGSWAGAMGQNQFMPSSFMAYAVDDNKDGRRDIWTTPRDVFASTANYLNKARWTKSQGWGVEIIAPADLIVDVEPLKTEKSWDEWKKLGIRLKNPDQFVDSQVKASLAMPDGVKGRMFLVYDNYASIMAWNRSQYFATAVGLFADALLAN